MINVVCGIRSTGRICTDLATALEAQGHEVKIAYGRENVPEQFQKYAVRIGSDLDVKMHGVKARLLDDAGFGSKKATVKFIEWVKEYNPDVIHLHNIHGYYINVKVLFDYLRTCGKKIIWTLHDCWAFTGHTAYCDSIQCERWKKGCYNCPQIKEYPKSIIDRSKRNWKRKKLCFTGIKNMTLITPSHWLAELIEESYLSEYSVEVIHNGIDTTQFKPLRNDFRDYFGLKNKFIVLGVTSSWDKMKEYSDFIKIAGILDEECKVIMVGLTDEQLVKLPKNILGIGRTASVKELSFIYSSSDVVLNLSYCENHPIVNLKSRACGIPIITYATGGCHESAGKNGVSVERGDINAVLYEIKKIKDSRHRSVSELSELDEKNIVARYHENYQTEGYWNIKSRHGLSGKCIVLGVAAIWNRRKGLDDFLHIAQALDNNYQIILVGLTRQQIEKLPANIIGIDRTDSVSELAQLYALADVFINPTYEDNYPTTNLEAISCRTPVITYKTGGSPESAKMYGVIVPQKHIRDMVWSIKNIERVQPSKIDIDCRNAVYMYVERYKKL
jgi:glycosyltransferase involved in cell wall biosynthesis